jgi:16S rRNA processing protein RimM
MQDLIEVGFIKKTHGYKGDVRIVINDDVIIPETVDVFFLQVKGEKLPYFVDKMEHILDDEYIIHLEEITTKEIAQPFKATKLFLPKSKIETVNNVNDDAHELIGYVVEDLQKGRIGIVTDVYDLPQQELLGVQFGSKEVLIPLRLELIHLMQTDKKTIIFDLPEGLLEL